jgi:hypothetical protein
LCTARSPDGIAGAIAAQLVATRRAYANSLALFERQHAEQERTRRDEARREGNYRFAEHRRSAYARLLRYADELVAADEKDSNFDELMQGTSATSLNSSRWSTCSARPKSAKPPTGY